MKRHVEWKPATGGYWRAYCNGFQRGYVQRLQNGRYQATIFGRRNFYATTIRDAAKQLVAHVNNVKPSSL